MSANGRAVVLGGTGFVGRHVCAELGRRGLDVVVVARRPPGHEVTGPFLALDLGRAPTPDVLAELEAVEAGIVVNATGSIWGRTDEQMWEAVAVPTLRLLDALDRMADPPRLVHLGSVLEYGRIPPGTTADATAPVHPTSAYGRAKLAATEAVLERVRAGRPPGMVLRVANLAGPGGPDVSLPGRVAHQLLTAGGRPAVVELDPLLAHRDYVDVRDVADAVVAAALSEVSGELVDIGSGRSTAVRDLVDMVIERSGVPAVVVERAGAGGLHSTEDWSRVDVAPAARLLGWRPRRSLTEAVDAFWQEFVARKDNRDESEGRAT